MRAVFGAVTLLIALAVVGWLAARQLGSVGRVGVASAGAGAGSASGAEVPRSARQVEQQVGHDVAAALQRGAAARAGASDAGDAP